MTAKTKVKTRPYDSARYPTSEKAIALYLEEAFATGLGRESLCKALRAEGNPEMGTILKVASALGLRLTIERAAKT